MKKLVLGLTLALTVTACGGSTPDEPVKGDGGNGGNRQAPQVAIYTPEKNQVADAYLQPGDELVITTSDNDGRVDKLVYTLQRMGDQAQTIKVDRITGRNFIILPDDLKEGQYILTAIATDDKGLTSKDSAKFRIDLTPPKFTEISVNGNAIGGGPVSIVSDGGGLLKATAEDESGPVDLRLIYNDEIIAKGKNTLTKDLTVDSNGDRRPAGSYTFTLKAEDSSKLTTSQQISINISQPTNEGGPVEQAPTPVLQVVGEGPFAGDMSVNVAANTDAYSELKKMVLIVEDSEGFSDAKTYTTTEARQQFSVDTTRFTNGELKLRVEAFTESGLKGESSTETVMVDNINAPKISIVTPDNNASVNDSELPVKVTVTKVTSGYKFTDQKLIVRLEDYRGSIKARRILDVNDDCTGDTTGTITCNTSFDLGDGDAGIFTVIAETEVDVESLGRLTIDDKTRFTATVANASAPASNIVMPVRLSDDGADLKAEPAGDAVIPVLNRDSSIAAHASDNDGLEYMQVRFLYANGDPVNAYLLNRDLYGITDTYNVVSPVELDGSEYIADGNYILQMTTEDTLGNTNIQEIWVRVDRSAELSTGLETAAQFTDKKNSASGQLTHSSGKWGLGSRCDEERNKDTEQGSVSCKPLPLNSRIISLQYFRAVDGTTEILGRNIRPYFKRDGIVHDVVGFTNAGSYWVKWIIQDMDTGVVETYTGKELSVQKNE